MASKLPAAMPDDEKNAYRAGWRAGGSGASLGDAETRWVGRADRIYNAWHKGFMDYATNEDFGFRPNRDEANR